MRAVPRRVRLLERRRGRAAAFRKADDGSYAPLNPNGFFLGSKLAITLKIEDATTYNHLVLSVGDKEITVRPGVRAH